MTIYQKMQMQFLVFCSMLLANFAMAAGIDDAPTSASTFISWLTTFAGEFGPVKTAVVTIMGVLILILGIIQLGGFVAGVMRKMLG